LFPKKTTPKDLLKLVNKLKQGQKAQKSKNKRFYGLKWPSSGKEAEVIANYNKMKFKEAYEKKREHQNSRA
jgi:hypothetical protein